MTSHFTRTVTVAVCALMFGAIMGIALPPVSPQIHEVSASRA